ncbi:hypothetical protein Tcan_11577 [Toxocara canis]|uniref:ZP domain-containing protein n=1 Tax=Toxocara canis TaxID=6265 RepID=A0A0B2VSJ4_TOXCA|nr:hypothetical protein Tcan_11577 [Toxocara canis]
MANISAPIQPFAIAIFLSHLSYYGIAPFARTPHAVILRTASWEQQNRFQETEPPTIAVPRETPLPQRPLPPEQEVPPSVVIDEYTGPRYPAFPLAPEPPGIVQGSSPTPLPPAGRDFGPPVYAYSQPPPPPPLLIGTPGYPEERTVPPRIEVPGYPEQPQGPEPTQPRKYMTRESSPPQPKFETPETNVPPEFTFSASTNPPEYGAIPGPVPSERPKAPQYPGTAPPRLESTPHPQQPPPSERKETPLIPSYYTALTTPASERPPPEFATVPPFKMSTEYYETTEIPSPPQPKVSVSVERPPLESLPPQVPETERTTPPAEAGPPEGEEYTGGTPPPEQQPPRFPGQETTPSELPPRPQLPPREQIPPQQPTVPPKPSIPFERTVFPPPPKPPEFPGRTAPPEQPEFPQPTVTPRIPGVPEQPTIPTTQTFIPPSLYPQPSPPEYRTAPPPRRPQRPEERTLTPAQLSTQTQTPSKPITATSTPPSFPETQTSARPPPPQLTTVERTVPTRPTPPPVTPLKIVPNRLRGKARVVCEEIGLQFRITTLFPFTGQIFAHDRKRVPGCVHTFTEAVIVNVTLPYVECGIKNIGEQRAEMQYHMQIIVVFEQKDGTSTIQSFIAQCQHQKIQYQKSTIPKRIEEALEELHLVPTKLEQKAPIPECIMRIVKEEDHGHEGDGIEVEMVDLGQPMRIEWLLIPESDAYGFHVRNCTVRDRISGEEHLVIDERGCSTDINIFGHPHYDTYHDIARVHWHAFKVPDNSQLSIRCSFQICSDIADSLSGITSCDSIPSPPFCPDLITSPSNSILFDYEGNLVRKRSVPDSMHQQVHADICLGDAKDQYCNSDEFQRSRENHLRMIDVSERFCVSRVWLSVCTGLSAWTTLLAIGVHGYCRSRRKRRLTHAATTVTHRRDGDQRTRFTDRSNAAQKRSKYESTQQTTSL